MYYDQIKLLKKGVEKARGLLGDAIDVVPGLGTVNQGLLAAENIGRGNLAGAAENIQNLVPTGKIAGRAIKALTKGKGQSELSGLLSAKAPRQDALDLAQKRAALPVSEGGLGLPPDNTPMDRAKAGRFVVPVYRGQPGEEESVVAKRAPKNEQMNLSSVHVAEQPNFANIYAQENGSSVIPMLMRDTNILDATALVPEASKEFGILKQLLPRGQKPYLSRGGEGGPNDPMVSPPLQSYIDAAGAAKAEKVLGGFDAVKYNAKYGSMPSPGSGMIVNAQSPAYAVTKPEILRSRFAAFDPFRFGENDLLAIQGGLLGTSQDSSILNRYETDADRRMEIARRNAALPVEQGGLGLPENNTPMDRAGILFPKKGFHATGSDIQKIDPIRVAESDYGTIGQGFYIDPSPNAGYSNLVARINQAKAPQNIMPVRYRDDNLFDMTGMLGPDSPSASKSLTERLSDMGYQGTMSSVDGLPNEVAVFDPKIVRSEFAAFDPFRRNEADLLAIQGGLLGTSQDSSILNRYETDADRRMEIARRNAALPVEKGGLGLPENNTPMDRAKAMGFDVYRPLYHGTKAQDVTEMIPSRGGEYGSGVYAGDADIANLFASYSQIDGAENIIPLVSRASNPLLTDDRNVPRSLGVKKMQRQGYDSIVAKSPSGEMQNVVFDPAMLRSPFAAFDPFRRNESDLLAIQGGLLGTSQDSSILNRYETDADRRMEIARRNAALPVDQGGLGLPENNTPMDRARAMGFSLPQVHFSRHGADVSELDSGKFAIAPFDAVGTHVGSADAAMDRFKTTVGTSSEPKGASYPLMVKTGEQFVSPKTGGAWSETELLDALWERGGYATSGETLQSLNPKLRRDIFRGSGYDSIPYVNDVEAKGEVSNIVPPWNIRSRFAAFDPMRRNESDLLALQGGQYMPQDLLGFERMMGLLGE